MNIKCDDLNVRDIVSITDFNGNWEIVEIVEDNIRLETNGSAGDWVHVSQISAIVKKYDEKADRDICAEIAYHEQFAASLKAGKVMVVAQKEAEKAQANVYGSWEI